MIPTSNRNQILNQWVIPVFGMVLLLTFSARHVAPSQVSETTFTDVTKEAGLSDNGNVEGAAWGDFDGDGDLDLFTCHHITVPPAGLSILYRNNSDGTFTEVFRMQDLLGRITRNSTPDGENDDHSPAWGDFDNDGDPDLFIARGHYQTDSLLRNDGGGAFTDIAQTAGVADPGGRGRTASWADIDNDGHLDLFIANNASSNRLFRNRGDGTFADITAQAGLTGTMSDRQAVAWADYDQDGFVDVFITEARDERERDFDPPVNRLYHNNGNLTFTDVTTAAGLLNEGLSQGAMWGDFDNDGDQDLFVANESAPYRLYENNGHGTFTDIAAQAGVAYDKSGKAAIWGDFDNDGDLDLFVIATPGSDLLYRNNGDKTFTNIAPLAGVTANGSAMQFGASWADYNNDGFLDLFLTDQRIAGGRFSHLLYRNNRNPNHWLKIQLVGTRSNRDGIGAKITLTAGSKIQYREQNGGSHLLSQNSPLVHFGLNQSARLDSLEIKWPSGLTQRLTDLAADQTLRIIEPDR